MAADSRERLLAYIRNDISTAEDPRDQIAALRMVLLARFEETGSLEDLGEITDLDLKAWKLTPPLHEDFTTTCRHLCHDFMNWYWTTKKDLYASRAVYFGRLAVSTHLSLDSALPQTQTSLYIQVSITLVEYASTRRSRECFDEAVTLARKAAAVEGLDHKVHEFSLRNLAESLEKRYIYLGDVNDLKQAIELFDELSPPHVERASSDPVSEASCRRGASHDETSSICSRQADSLYRLGQAVFRLWELQRDDGILDRALTMFRSALEAYQNKDAGYHETLLNYINYLFQVYIYSPEIRHLKQVDDLLNEASDMNFLTNDGRLRNLAALGTLLDLRSERNYDPAESFRAVETYEEALMTAPSGASIRNVLLNNIINSSMRYSIYSRQEPGTEASSLIKKMEKWLVEGDAANDSDIWINSARLYHLEFQQSNHQEALVEAARRVRKALESEKGGETESVRMATLSSPILKDYWILTKMTEDYDLAFRQLMISWKAPTTSPATKIQAARDAAEMLYRSHSFKEAWHLMQQAVELITMACPRRLERDDQRMVIANALSGLSNDACATGLAAGANAVDVLIVLEKARGVAVALAHAANEEVRNLTSEARRLYEEFEDIKARFYFYSSGTELPQLCRVGETYLDSSDLRQKAWQDFQAIAERVNKIPELVRLTSTPTTELFHSLASDGPIIVLNSSQLRSDVILVTESRISSFELRDDLPELLRKYGLVKVEDVSRRIVRLVTRGDKGDWLSISARNQTLTGMLMWLWDYVGKRVCDELSLAVGHASALLQRIWWMPTGHFTQLPLHAAGRYADGDLSQMMINRAVSSYVSSFRMLRWIRSRWPTSKDQKLDGMIVSMAGSPQARRRASKILVRTAKQEADIVQREANNISWERDDLACVTSVMEALPNKNFMHFICHGESDPNDPSRSHLKLFSRKADEVDDPRNVENLTVIALSSAVTDSAILAVLSACFTTDIREHRLLDEGLHIGTSFQLAGVPHVIGSLWATSDVVCPRFSEKFYSSLNTLMDLAGLNSYVIALAYHAAIIRVQNEYAELPILWVPFVHLGP